MYIRMTIRMYIRMTSESLGAQEFAWDVDSR